MKALEVASHNPWAATELLGKLALVETVKFISVIPFQLVALIIALAFLAFVHWGWNPECLHIRVVRFDQPVTTENVLSFWPLLVWGTIAPHMLSGLARCYKASIVQRHRSSSDERTYALRMLVSVHAGVFEELSFRYIGIYSSMLGLYCTDWLQRKFFWVLIIGGLLAPFAILWSEFKRLKKELAVRKTYLCSVPVIWGATILAVVMMPPQSDFSLVFLLERGYREATSAVTFHAFDDVIGAQSPLPEIFVFGALTSNATFRDGHKYQGALGGLIHGWQVFCGLPTAMAVHVLYDVCVFSSIWFQLWCAGVVPEGWDDGFEMA
eukprot:CAMPEP_0114571968 /NCGR_PEP_ID=MMETSP0114-20121206/18026_1 /TAXON_ID=31324 /ORGANISM="Goniomonas sp, Strain m" /LENGTH=322 /DNA_ID=CAMNT_0001759117 /DNA_START=53 /DNA_END=1022 /DNA_ORIENTATION=-